MYQCRSWTTLHLLLLCRKQKLSCAFVCVCVCLSVTLAQGLQWRLKAGRRTWQRSASSVRRTCSTQSSMPATPSAEVQIHTRVHWADPIAGVVDRTSSFTLIASLFAVLVPNKKPKLIFQCDDFDRSETEVAKFVQNFFFKSLHLTLI